ncbi:MAG: hypothetical protein KAJ13_07820 [Gemmatimonadetes bacterium]|nr:hypothetical protein [Gemmatimonadota bacterium]MCK5483597.1 hypothetical protein [Gemmatimonadota bacterium]
MRFVIVGLALLLVAGCSSEDSEPTRSQGARDTAIAESALPGAAGVKRALAVSDSAEARRALQDSIMRTEEP